MSLLYTVVVPVYNAQTYLESCIESVLNQSTGSEFEMILVNDGSRDRSAEICDRYAARYECIHAIHQVNQGVSAARNAGIAAAKGQYVLFLDSDDLWDEKLLESLDCFTAKQPDLIEFGYCRFGERGITGSAIPVCPADGKSGVDYVAQLEAAKQLPTAACWAAAYKRCFLLEHDLRFPMGIRYGEDFFFYMHCMKRAQSVYTVPAVLYRYRINEASVTHTPNPKSVRDVITVGAQMYRLFPNSAFADYYCMRIWLLESLEKKDADRMKDLLRENRDILRHVSGVQARFARSLYGIFGWYYGAKVLRVISVLRKMVKG